MGAWRFPRCPCSLYRNRLNIHPTQNTIMSAEKKKMPAFSEEMSAAMITAFEFGYRCCEKGMNLQRALEHYQKTVAPEPEPEKV
jgi:hypothetical protein